MRSCFMGRRPTPKRRCPLDLETLEGRLTPAGAPELTIPLDPMGDRYGDQIVTVQAYQDASRAALSIFDTGATALTFSARDQAYFTAQGNPIRTFNDEITVSRRPPPGSL